MKLELLAIIGNVSISCGTKENLISLIQGCTGIKINNSKISLNKNKEFNFEVKEKSLESQSKYYSIIISNSEESEQNVVELSQILSSLKAYFHTYNSGIDLYVVENDISTYYAQRAYPIINSIENTLRTLILKLMLVSVGINWSDKNIPTDVKSKIERRNNDKDIFENILWEMDFIHLSNFLFTNTRFSDLNKFDALLQGKSSDEKVRVGELTPFTSENNWQRYFTKKTSIDPKTLKESWEKMYELRNKVAHNREFQKHDFDNIDKYSKDLMSEFQQAIEAIEQDQIILTPEQQLNIKANVDASTLVIQELIKSKNWQEQQNQIHPNTFIGYKKFLNICEGCGVEKEKTAEILSDLEKSKSIELYNHIRNDYDDYGVYSIRILNLGD